MPATRTPQLITINTGNVTWTNQPAALTELFGNVHRRVLCNMTDVDKIRLSARVSTQGVAAAVIFAEYSLDESSWSPLTGALSLFGTGTKATAWEPLAAGARSNDVFIRIVGQDGNGAADPVLGNISLEVI